MGAGGILTKLRDVAPQYTLADYRKLATNEVLVRANPSPHGYDRCDGTCPVDSIASVARIGLDCEPWASFAGRAVHDTRTTR